MELRRVTYREIVLGIKAALGRAAAAPRFSAREKIIARSLCDEGRREMRLRSQAVSDCDAESEGEIEVKEREHEDSLRGYDRE